MPTRSRPASSRSSSGADQPAVLAGPDAIYGTLFDSFDRDKEGRVSQWEVLSRLQRSGLLPDDPRIQEALTGLRGAGDTPKPIDFQQFRAIAQHNSSLIRRAVEGNLAVPDFAALRGDVERMYSEVLTV